MPISHSNSLMSRSSNWRGRRTEQQYKTLSSRKSWISRSNRETPMQQGLNRSGRLTASSLRRWKSGWCKRRTHTIPRNARNGRTAEAAADVRQGYQAALEANQRGMERMGINPATGKFQAAMNDINLGFARDSAGAMNKARRDTELQGMAMRQGVAQFGRNMPTTGIASDAAALNAGNSATDNLATKAGLHNAGTNAAQNWFGGATGANSAAGNLALGQYQGQLNAWQQASQNSASSAAGLGNLIGQLGSAYMMKPVPLRR